MLNIGELYLQHTDGQVRLCADVALNGRGTTLWFGVDEKQGDYLCGDRSDAFVMALLPTAMRTGQDIVCQTPMSERLHYQLEQLLIPSVCAAGTLYHPIHIQAPLTAEKVNSKGAVATGFSGGVDSLHTIMTHGKDSAYPLTHLTLFNLCVFEGAAYRQGFQISCCNAQRFADEMGLELVGLDSNLPQVLPERFLDVFTYRLLAGALVLQGLLSTYLISSSYDLGTFRFDLHDSGTHDFFLIHCAQTESMSLYDSGVQMKRVQKIKELSNWEPAHRWLHFCIFGHVGEKNCGRCKKCARDISTLYGLGALERFKAVVDIPAFRRTLPQQLGLVLANRGENLYDEAAKLVEASDAKIPQAAYVYAEQFQKAMKNLQEEQK